MKRITTVFLALASAALVGLAPTAAAQVLTRERVVEALDRTDQRIEAASALVAGVDNPQAELELEAARDLQAQARLEFGGNRLRGAMDLTLRARARADRAIALVKGLPDPDRVLAQLERTRDIVERARERVQECDQDRARALIRVATEMQMRAETAARESRFLAALQLTLGARDRAHRALRMCRIEEDIESAAALALQRSGELIARARTMVDRHDPSRAREVLARAADLQAQAQARFADRQFEASLRLATNAGALARRAIRLAERPR